MDPSLSVLLFVGPQGVLLGPRSPASNIFLFLELIFDFCESSGELSCYSGMSVYTAERRVGTLVKLISRQHSLKPGMLLCRWHCVCLFFILMWLLAKVGGRAACLPARQQDLLVSATVVTVSKQAVFHGTGQRLRISLVNSYA